RRTIGIFAAKRILLAIAPPPVLIAVDLVRSDADDRFDPRREPRRLKHMRSSERIGGEGLDRVGEGFRDQRLRGEVNDHRWGKARNCISYGREIADVTNGRGDA